MVRFLGKVTAKLRIIMFFTLHSSRFSRLGSGSILQSPFRVDGAEGISVGEKTVFQRGVWLYCCGIDSEIKAQLKIGKGCVFGYNNHITSVQDVVIGDYVLTANNVYISDNLHGYEDIERPIMCQQVNFKAAVSVGSGSWIGENVCIIGAKVGRNCVIGANAVVTKDIPDYSVAVGSPAKVIKQYCFENKIWVSVGSEAR
jgi:acetyltransferase-like isoleucine patch superfamily enzyme